MPTSFNGITKSELNAAIIRNPIVVSPDTTVMAAIAQMSELRSQYETIKDSDYGKNKLHIDARSSCVLVVKSERVVGILTERDVVRLSAERRSLDLLTVGEVMTHPVFTMRESALTDFFATVNLFLQQRIRHLPIVDAQDRLVGIATHESLRHTSRPIDLLRLRLVSEVMSRDVVCAQPEQSMLAIAQIMTNLRVSSVVITADDLVPSIAPHSPQPIGIVTERDIVQFQALGLNLDQCAASGMMSSPIFTVNPTDSLFVVYGLMEQHFISRVVVTDCDNHLLGIVTQSSLLQAFNPIELYNLATVLEQKVLRLEAEKIALLESRNLELEQQQVLTYQQLQAELKERQKTEIELIDLNQSLEAKVAERTQELQVSNAKIRAMIDAVPDLLLRINRHGDCLEYINTREYLNKFTTVQSHVSKVLPPDLCQRQLDAITQALITGRLQIYEHELYDKYNQLTYEEVRIVPICNDEAMIIIRDQTEQKKTELALKASEARFRGIFDANVVGMLFLNLQGEIIEANDCFLDLIGYSRDDLENGQIEWQKITVPEYLPLDLHAIAHVKLNGVIESWEKLYYHKDGHPVSVLSSLAKISETECVCVVVDISDLKRTEQIIAQQTQQEILLREITERIRTSLNLQTIFDTAVTEMQRVLDCDRVLVYRVYADGTGAAVAESVSPPYPQVLNIVFPEEVFPQVNYDRYVQGRVFTLSDAQATPLEVLPCLAEFLAEINVRAKLVVPIVENDSLWGLLIAHQCDRPRTWQEREINLSQKVANQMAIAIQQASLFEQLQQELGDRQQAQQQLTERNEQLAISNAELARATRLKDEFLANMSHELRTPLNAILGMTEGLQEKVFGNVSESQIKALQTIERSGNHLLELINDILDVAKIESGQIELEYSNVAIASLCQSSLNFIKQQALKKRIQIHTKFPNNLPELYVDERRIRQVLINLLSNAVKFTPEAGTISLEASVLTLDITQDSDQADGYVRIDISDTGIGIATKNISKLFEPFFQIDSALNRQYEGTGLGLPIVKKIVEMHGGRVIVTSELGTGSCFTIDIPYKIAYSAPSQSHQNSNGIAVGQGSSQDVPTSKILLVEDNEANIMTVFSYLDAKGYEVTIARNGQEALDLLESLQPDLILMDMQMPIMDGLQATKRIRQISAFANTPIIAFTALAMPSDIDICLAAGANSYISKPVKLRELTQAIQRLLNHSASH